MEENGLIGAENCKRLKLKFCEMGEKETRGNQEECCCKELTDGKW